MTAPELVEVAEGRWLAADCSTAAHLEGAQQLAAEVEGLREDCEAMLAARPLGEGFSHFQRTGRSDWTDRGVGLGRCDDATGVP